MIDNDILVIMSGSGNSSTSSKLFGNDGGEMVGGAIIPDIPAKMNKLYNGNQMSASHSLGVFREKHANAKTESAIIMDDDGFVSVYRHGDKNSVGWMHGELTSGNLIHNHPNGSNFSKADLDTWSSTGLKSITASSTKVDYTVTKTNKFKESAFRNGISKAQTTKTDYNDAVDYWLKQNQKKYGYKYTVKKYD